MAALFRLPHTATAASECRGRTWSCLPPKGGAGATAAASVPAVQHADWEVCFLGWTYNALVAVSPVGSGWEGRPPNPRASTFSAPCP